MLLEPANEQAGSSNAVSSEQWEAWLTKRIDGNNYAITHLPNVVYDLKVILFGGLVSLQGSAESCVTWLRPDGKEAMAGDLIGCPTGPVWVVDLFLKVLGINDYTDFWARLDSVADDEFKGLWQEILRI